MSRRPLAALLVVIVAGAGCSLQPVDLNSEKPLALRSTILDGDGRLLTRIYNQNRTLVEYEAFPAHLVTAVISAEDARFFEHSGFDLRAIARAALANLGEGEVVQGGSTITQQYVKNTYFRNPSKTFKRKARELRLAIEVERSYSKEEIFDRYLNTVYFGAGAYGVAVAARNYFGHGVGGLTLSESALLASLIKSPAIYDPRDNPKKAKERRDYVLDRMADLGHITDRTARRARERGLGVTKEPPQPTLRQPYFVEAATREVLKDRRLGLNEQERARSLYKGGLRIETTLEPRLQRAAERATSQVLNRPGDPSAALVAIRPDTGAIVAMVGGRDWSLSQVNLALGKAGGGSGRQPGSSFKPIDLATALESGHHLTDRYESSPVRFTFDGGSTWTVDNAEGRGYGLMTLEEALVHSVNGVYARLAVEIGPGQIATQAHLMGVRSKLPIYPSIALGSAEVSVLDMASAYATLANGGTAIEPTTIKSIRTSTGEVLRPDQAIVEQAVSPGNAYLITKTMEQVIERGTGVAASIGRPAAGKTGTTNDYADAWFVGYTPQLVTAVWVGYPQGRIPMTSVHGIRVQGGTFPAQIWRSFMLAALAGEPVQDFRIPRSELVKVFIDPDTGLLAAPWCPGKPEVMLRQLMPTDTCPPPPPPEPTPLPTPEPTPTDDQRGDKDSKDPSPKPTPEPTKSSEPTPEPSPAKTKSK